MSATVGTNDVLEDERESDSNMTMETMSVIDESENRIVNNGAIADNHDDKDSTGYGSWYTVDVFLFFLTSFQLLNLLTLTYTDSVLNYISKRFQIPNTMASFIPSSYQVGSVVAIIPVSYFGARWHRPRAICIGVMLMILGLGFCILPHFILPNDKYQSQAGSYLLCKRDGISPFLLERYQKEFARHNVSFPKFNVSTGTHTWDKSVEHPVDQSKHEKISWLNSILRSISANYHTSSNRLFNPSLTTPTDLPCNANATTYNPSLLLILGHVFIGAGSSPLWPLGVAYLDEHVVSRKMPVYLGIFIGTTLTGPVAGFLLGSLSSVIYVTIDAHDLKPSDPAWIGAWWLGYVIAGGLLIILLIPFYFFPEHLEVSDEKLKEREQMNAVEAGKNLDDDGRTSRANSVHSETRPLLVDESNARRRIWEAITESWLSTKRLLSSPLVLCCFLAYISLSNLLSGVSTFGSTFVQREFNIGRMTADMLIGGVIVPLAIAGTFLGGYLMKRYDFTINQSLVFNVTMSTVGTILLTTLFGLGCQTAPIAGINRPYFRGDQISLISACNEDCLCTKGEMSLLCSTENITYVSPCFAGCMTHIPASKDGSSKQAYYHCSCLEEIPSPLTVGPCSTINCGRILAGAIIVASIGNLILCLCQAPTYSMLLRGLTDEDKPLAIGLLTFLSRILGFIPAPIWFALVIDSSCIYWGPECNGRAYCKLYNNKGLRINFVGACVACSFLYAVVFAIGAFWFLYKEHKDRKEKLGKRSDMIRERLARMRSFTR